MPDSRFARPRKFSAFWGAPTQPGRAESPGWAPLGCSRVWCLWQDSRVRRPWCARESHDECTRWRSREVRDLGMGTAPLCGGCSTGVRRCSARCSNGTPATVDDVNAIAPLMDRVTPADLGIVPPTRAANHLALRLFGRPGTGPRAPQYPPLEYLKLHESAAFAMGVFCFPENGKIPLHDHPGMTVVSKLLYGRVRVLSYDWAKTEDEDSGVVVDCDADVSTRGSGDWRAGRGPRYSRPSPLFRCTRATRTCTCSTRSRTRRCWTSSRRRTPSATGAIANTGRETPSARGEPCGENEAWLLETECPESFQVNRGSYVGPRVGSEAGAGDRAWLGIMLVTISSRLPQRLAHFVRPVRVEECACNPGWR